MVQLSTALAAVSLAGSAFAHPGHDVKAEGIEARTYLDSKPRDIASCAAKLKARGHTDKAIARRSALAKRMMKKRDEDDVLGKNHKSNLTGITPDTDSAVLFADSTNCILHPEVTEGPYFVTGELIRRDVREGEPGIDAYVFVQFIDTAVCEPIPDLYVDFWQANSTGVYGGIVGYGNGDEADLANINKTAFRGVQPTDEDGIAEFLTVVPGHYTGRTQHIHLLTHRPEDLTVFPNGTLGTNANRASHVGQIYFDQDLVNEVETYAPYNANEQPITTNARDFILLQQAQSSDPVVEYVLLGDNLEDGILSWITVGIDTTRSTDAINAAYIGEDGGHATGNSPSPPGGDFPFPPVDVDNEI